MHHALFCTSGAHSLSRAMCIPRSVQAHSLVHHMYMPKKSRQSRPKQPVYGAHFLREWRIFAGQRNRGREYTLEEVGEAIHYSHAQLGRIERRLQKYNQQLLENLAEFYGTDPASLLMRNPMEPDAFWSLWDQAQKGERDDTHKFLEYRVKTRQAS